MAVDFCSDRITSVDQRADLIAAYDSDPPADRVSNMPEDMTVCLPPPVKTLNYTIIIIQMHH